MYWALPKLPYKLPITTYLPKSLCQLHHYEPVQSLLHKVAGVPCASLVRHYIRYNCKVAKSANYLGVHFLVPLEFDECTLTHYQSAMAIKREPKIRTSNDQR